jgi:HAE1 family hydrophobic/amphiphilic exporter-1
MLYSGIALTITYSILASLLAAITLVPMLAARLKLKRVDSTTPDAQPQTSPLAGLVAKVAAFTVILQAGYKKIIAGCISLRYVVLIVTLALFALALQQSRKLEKEFIGIAEQNKFTIFIELPTGTKLEISDKVVGQVEDIVAKVPEIKTSTAKIEPWSSKIYVELVPLSKRKKSVTQIIAGLRPLTEKMDPAFIYYEEPEEVGTKEILIELYGYDYEVLKSLAIQVAQKMQSIPKFTDTKIRMREGRPEMRLTIDKRQAAMFGLTVEDIALALHTHMRGLVATRFRGTTEPLIRTKDETFSPAQNMTQDQQKILKEQQKEIRQIQSRTAGAEAKETETIVRLKEKFRRTFEDLRRISLVTPDGNQVYFSQLADFKFDLGPSEIWRKNKSRMVQVSANTGGVALGTAAEKVQAVVKDMKFPKDYCWQFGGNYDKMIRNQKELAFALLLSLVLVYMLLACMFESISEPFIILFTVPLATIGAVAALRITHKPVGTGVLIGAIMLGGIVVNNAIVLVDRINFLRRKFYGSDHTTAVIMASADRLRPIMMTSLTTIIGLIPMALDKSESSNLWSPLAITAIGGMTVSTFLTLLVIPCIYFIFKDLRLIHK